VAEEDASKGMSREAADALAHAKELRELAEVAKLGVETAREEANLTLGQMQLEEATFKHRQWQASDVFAHVYYFSDPVNESTAENCTAVLDLWDRLDPACHMTIVFNSPGGDVIAGFALFDHIMSLRNKGHKINTVTEGLAASMAGILLQAGEHRSMGRQTWILIHEASFGTTGKTFQVEDRVEWVKKVQERILDIFADRAKQAGEAGTASKPLSRAQFKKNWDRKDWWLSSDDCLKFGIVDELL